MKLRDIAFFLFALFLVHASISHADPLQVASMDKPRYTPEEASIEDGIVPENKSEEADSERPRPSVLHRVLLYVPNRVLDLFDIFRVRVRVGPGIAVGARASKYVQAYLGSYGALYAGLPGSRQRTTPRSPIGVETNTGVTVSVLDATIDGGFGPEYSPTEVGAGVQVAVVGIDLGIDPWEIVDFAAGLFTLDVRDDDY